MLVVIGILIALSINNWNEGQKIEKTEKEILQSLNIELQANLKSLKAINDQHKTEFEDGMSILKTFGSDISSIPTLKLDSITTNAFAGYSFEARDGYIKSLIASNKIDYIENAELKAFISSFESMVIDAVQEEGYIRRLLNERLWPATDGKLSFLNGNATFGGYEEFPKGTYESDYEWFFHSREMEDLTANIMTWKKENINDENTLIVRIVEMINLINIELKEK